MRRTHRRSATKLLRLHPHELAHITARARACGQTPARVTRETALGARRKAGRRADIEPLLRALARIGSNLEQIARFAHSGGGGAALTQRVALALDHDRPLVGQVLHGGR